MSIVQHETKKTILTMREDIKNYFLCFRPFQNLKNTIFFLPLIFSNSLWSSLLLWKVSLFFILFFYITGFVYITNDIHDRKNDRTDKEKSKRPIANGKVDIQTIFSVWILFCALSLGLIFKFYGVLIFSLTIIFLWNSFLYTYLLKNTSIWFLAIILNYVLRAWLWTLIIEEEISLWFLAMVGLLSWRFWYIKKYPQKSKNIWAMCVWIIIFYGLYCIFWPNTGALWTLPFFIIPFYFFTTDILSFKNHKKDISYIILSNPRTICFTFIYFISVILSLKG